MEVNERRLAQADLQEQRDFSRQLTEAMSQGLIVYDLVGTVEYANPFMSHFSGYSLDEIIGQRLDQFVAPDYRDALVENLRRRNSGIVSDNAYELVVVDIMVGAIMFWFPPRHFTGKVRSPAELPSSPI
ncbi:MAG: PAS domain S-box protein [Anaerolineales bacterium]|nr:PAS domain S-box protein [Anaerolineales bacterium]